MWRIIISRNSERDVDKVLAFIKAHFQSKQICENTRGSVFIGKGTLTKKELEYAIQCKKEIQSNRTW